jgi:hypothetical protein
MFTELAKKLTIFNWTQGQITVFTRIRHCLILSPMNPVHTHKPNLFKIHVNIVTFKNMSRVAQSVQWLTTDWTSGVRSPTEAEDFSSNLCVQTGSRAHPASCTVGTGGSFPGVKGGRGVTLTTHPLLVPRLRKSRSCTSCHPNAPLWSVTGPLYLFYLLRLRASALIWSALFFTVHTFLYQRE